MLPGNDLGRLSLLLDRVLFEGAPAEQLLKDFHVSCDDLSSPMQEEAMAALPCTDISLKEQWQRYVRGDPDSLSVDVEVLASHHRSCLRCFNSAMGLYYRLRWGNVER